jgi:hypothetical protein
MVAESDAAISEIHGDTAAIEIEMVHVWVLDHGQPLNRSHGTPDGNFSVTLRLPPWRVNGEFGRLLGQFSETLTSQPEHSWLIFDWVATLSVSMGLRAATGPALATGAATLTITGYGSLRLTVSHQGAPSVTKLDSVAGTDLECDSKTATRFLFGPTLPFAVLDVPMQLQPLFASWCPLPLYVDPPDSV